VHPLRETSKKNDLPAVLPLESMTAVYCLNLDGSTPTLISHQRGGGCTMVVLKP